ncbi:sugar phosphate nucleotidyltransferase [Alkalicoccobacillus murimartini]|uniref:Mannose-1-phosphate guanylyltransferase n=1 Tax=Alkalicoccobacillus murimartini TaxID=171685 RepID=A0ABT9YGD4_9BACI|nr:sugar phosphate nucleotidyltransferase [Alkalicoccobacillus murimartini]MDQ0206920.1 mannose-1-phosphate guanylyltransferase [Alkalicoccobacillus murimartini]
MNIVLLSGGSGKRLWPLSNDTRSKQFLKVLKDEEGHQISMVQRVWKQLKNVKLDQHSVIATGKSQVDMIDNQLGREIDVVVEPERRDTFPAIALAAVYLYSVRGVSLDEVVAVLPVDSYVEDGFFKKVKEMESALNDSEANIALLGVKPTYPSEKYGYIVPEKLTGDSYSVVSHFKEKPKQKEASQLIKEHALWNCGVVAFKLDYMITWLTEAGLPISYDSLSLNYTKLEKISFDYAVLEQEKNVITLSYQGTWKDLGTWNTLTEEMSSSLVGKGIIGDDCANTHLINELDIPVAVMGMKDTLVAASPDGILVSSKQASPGVKELTAAFEGRPMYEERRWGWYRVIDYSKLADGNEVLTKRIGIASGKSISYQVHHRRSEVWTIIQGEGECVLNDLLFPVKAGDVLQIPLGAKHAIRANSDLEFIEVQTGSELIEEDIVRIRMTWEEVEQLLIAKAHS